MHKVLSLWFDSVDSGRLNEARNELHLLLKEDELRGAFLLVYANKQDLLGAMNVAEVYPERVCHHCEGLYKGLDWLANNIASKVNLFDGLSKS
ncbi:putative small GTPase superfamily, ARF/SAR type, P-loop containing nucleoside triphosphate hydrolase [Helianthus anomalus]